MDATNTDTSTATPLDTQIVFEILDDVILPESKRGRIGVAKYPFEKLGLGKTFFVPQSIQIPNPMKTLTSAVAAAKMKFARQVGTVVKTRAKRGPKNALIYDDSGQRIMETKEVPVYEFDRKFTLRPVQAGVAYGRWQAPNDGVIVQRVL